MRAVVLISGGMDSLVVAAQARALGYELAAMHVNYGQRTWQKELTAFRRICSHYAIERKLEVDAAYLEHIGGSSLTDSSIPVEQADLQTVAIPSSYVPFRNASFLSMAVSWSEVIGAERIFIGAVEEDSSGYPDCRKIFYDAFNKVIELGTKPETTIEIRTPLIDLQKSEIVRKGVELDVPFFHSWSCYKSEGKACGLCDSCARRLRAFQLVGLDDPIDYEVRPDYI
ncbi:MAG: 7-cyano-7-deazaguanine synthase QueC [Chlorobium phaeobacteroides]|uniref:7-cyano-7-deazaguanine synthase n=1 Tax=Chlorobium phaeobacteroides (strain BS1) TaxID=331678 RepID=QUEC_CHLPB|nr:RecName: Full=7-cyano-7-deazaguanine synthase; AltName: Full=7-cyano-7-carbaguanine synthase; AltName: Full=PreQ(0) synthase; AltName: Full=Queuosine biosynthesis protein QueC [Chlorobium phaeobacteroides BS1]MBC8524953.1 7-cyano-7-deazaguanine synthase QueC [Chlorobium phaeobacteroides]MBL6955930.1 7-cyano-7-deazaguanine synthase QueC [Chlorobium phaeobacteroides]NEX13582.1 7-cyano-7-deazaguanine synthase [Prosthecochloris sp.]